MSSRRPRMRPGGAWLPSDVPEGYGKKLAQHEDRAKEGAGAAVTSRRGRLWSGGLKPDEVQTGNRAEGAKAKYPNEAGLDLGMQTFRRLMGETVAIFELGRDLVKWQEPAHGTLCLMRARCRRLLEYLDALLAEESE